MTDIVDHPPHYTQSPRGTVGECYDYARWMTFPQGNAFKYVWRAGQKGDKPTDLKKASWYLTSLVSDIEGGRVERPACEEAAETIDPNAGFQARILRMIAVGEFEEALTCVNWYLNYTKHYSSGDLHPLEQSDTL